MPKAPKSRSSTGFSGNKGPNADGSLGGVSRSGSFGNGGVAPSRFGTRANPTTSSNTGKDEKKKAETPATSAAPPPTQTGTPATPAPILPRAPDNPASTANPNLPADKVQAERGSRRPDRTLLDAVNAEPGASRSAQKYKGSVLSAVYKLPSNPANAAKTLQQFNGPRGQKMTLGA